jgi:hypothetical protein
MQFLVQPQAADFKDAEGWFHWRDFANGETLDNRGELGIAAGAVEQRHANLLLEIADRIAHD